MRALLFTLLLLCCGGAAAATVYTWVDAQGVTHYSDKPHPGAHKLQIEAAQTIDMPKLPPQALRPAAPVSSKPKPPHQEHCAIEQPRDQETLFNLNTVTGRMTMPRDAQPNRQVTVYYDSKPLQGITSATGQFTLSPVYRGTHTLAATVSDAQGHQLCRTPTITFYVHKPSRLAPHKSSRPRF